MAVKRAVKKANKKTRKKAVKMAKKARKFLIKKPKIRPIKSRKAANHPKKKKSLKRTKKIVKKIIKKTRKIKQVKHVKSRKVLAKKKKRAVTKTKNKFLKPKKRAVIKRIKRNKPKIRKKIIKKRPKIKKAATVKRPAKPKKQLVQKPAKKIHVRAAGEKKTGPGRFTEFPAEALFKAKIKVIGIGGGGGSIVSEIGRSLQKATFVIADTDVRALKKKTGIKYIWFGEELTHGLGTGVNIDLAKKAAESAKEKISSAFQDQDIIIFIASLGGGLGSGATQVFAEAAREFGGITFGIFTLPFKFEGENKYRIAQNALKSLRKSLNVSLVIPNEKIFKIIDANTPITQAFSVVNKSLIESLESLIDLIYNPGIINIDFADLRTILKGIGNFAFLNTIEEGGKDRAGKICEKVFFNPLLQNNNFKAEKILFNISGSENLSMFEVDKVSRHIAEKNPEAKIIFGISKNSKLRNKIKTTILMTGGGEKEEARPEKEAIKIIEKPAEKVPVKKTENQEAKKRKKPKIKKQKPKKPARKQKPKNKKPSEKIERVEEPVAFSSVFENPLPVFEERRLNVVGAVDEPVKKAIRRSGLEIKKAEEREEKKRQAQEKEWEIPAFLRRAKQ